MNILDCLFTVTKYQHPQCIVVLTGSDVTYLFLYEDGTCTVSVFSAPRKMVLPIVLKKRHTLRGIVIRQLKNIDPSVVSEYARVQVGKRTEDMALDDVIRNIKELIDDDVTPDEIFELARRDDTRSNARLLLHILILQANEFGQPKGQDLVALKNPNSSVVPGTSSSDTQEDKLVASTTKRKRETESVNLEERIASLEKVAKVEMVQELKQKVRTLCLQQEPSEPLILLTIDELAKTARKVKHEEADVFEELARQANRYQAKLDISNLCLSVLGGKAADAIRKAIAKCIKEGKSDSKCGVKDTLPLS